MAKYEHPKEHLITDGCSIEIYPSLNEAGHPDGYYIAVINENDELILREYEPDFDWASQTANFFSKRHNLEITDVSPY